MTQPWSRPVADELWLLSHHERSGRPKVDEQRVALGLAGAIICELLIDGVVTMTGERHLILHQDPRYGRDEVTRWALTELNRAGGRVPLPQWILHLCRESTPRVAERLAQAGAVEHLKAGLLGRRRAVAVSANVAAAPRVRLLHQLVTGQVDVATLTLGALAVAIDLDTIISRDAVAPGLRDDLIYAATEYLHQHLRDVADAVGGAADQDSTTVRR